MSSAIVRQWMILSMLPLRPRRIDTATLEGLLRARGALVHRRTIQRDLIELAAIFPIVADDRARPFGWRWSDEASFIARLPHLPADAKTVDVTIRVARTALESLVSILAKVEAVEIVGRPA